MKLKHFLIPGLMAALSMSSCKKSEYVNTNLDPNTLYSIEPADQFLAASVSSVNDFEYYYDVYRSMNLWMQYSTIQSGNSGAYVNPGSHFDYRYSSVFYSSVGPDLADIPALVSKMNQDQQPAYVHMESMAMIFKAYYAFYVSDINGSIPYSQAFQGRYGGITEPVYDRQQNLFDTLDLQLKTAVTTLETSQSVNQILPVAKDPFYGAATDETLGWIKAANALRIRLAMRLMKQDPAKMKSIVTEVLADANQMASNDDSWVLTVGPNFAKSDGNFNPNGFAAGKSVLDFMVAQADPRLRNFYTKAGDGTYRGASSSPDDATANVALFKVADTFSVIEPRMFTPNYAYNGGTNAGTGDGFFPYLTYAEYCFMRADLGARGVTSDDPATWYKDGITASINFYDERASAALIQNYTAVTPAEIAAYLAAPDVVFNPATATEQIADQAFFNFYRQPSEAWAWWKRTGFPSTSSSLFSWTVPKFNGNVLTLPRRAVLSIKLPEDPNYANQQAAYTEMASDAGFGSGPDDPTGRVWWDKP